MNTWILTGGVENFRIYVERGFDVIGMKEGRRRMAEGFEPGDEIIFYVSGLQAFGGIAKVRSGHVRGPHADLAAGKEEEAGGLPVAGRG